MVAYLELKSSGHDLESKTYRECNLLELEQVQAQYIHVTADRCVHVSHLHHGTPMDSRKSFTRCSLNESGQCLTS